MSPPCFPCIPYIASAFKGKVALGYPNPTPNPNPNPYPNPNPNPNPSQAGSRRATTW